MATIQNYEYCYPSCPPQPHHYFPTPSKVMPPPPPPNHLAPPLPPHTPPPPPPHRFSPLPPHVVPPQPQPPRHHSTVIIVIFVSLGGLFFLAFLSVALCCFVKKRKKNTIQKTGIVRIDEHVKIKETIVPGPHGPEAVILSIEEDAHIEEVIKKNEVSKKGVDAMSAGGHHRPHALKHDASVSEPNGLHIEHNKS